MAAASPLELAEGATGAGSAVGVGGVGGGGGGGGGQNQSPSLQRREEKKERRAAKAEQGRDEQVGATCNRKLLMVIFLKYDTTTQYHSHRGPILQLREVKEEAEGEDAVSSSSQLARWEQIFFKIKLFLSFDLIVVLGNQAKIQERPLAKTWSCSCYIMTTHKEMHNAPLLSSTLPIRFEEFFHTPPDSQFAKAKIPNFIKSENGGLMMILD